MSPDATTKTPFLHIPETVWRNAVAQHLGCCRVSQDVRPLDWRHDAGPLHEALHH
jgi:hypothetical protein